MVFLLLFCVAEELNWGQRIFGFATPAYFEENNVQHQISIHNLKPFHGHINEIYRLIGIAGTIISLSACAIPLPLTIKRIMFPWYISSYFAGGLYICTHIEQHRWVEQEGAEFLFALAFLINNVVALKFAAKYTIKPSTATT